MRGFWDRCRFALMFEGIGLVFATLFAVLVTGKETHMVASMIVVLMTLAMGVNFVFNLAFDAWEHSNRPNQKRTTKLRIVHAILYEVVVVAMTCWMIAWWLGISIWLAIVLDVWISIFFVAYTFVFSWIYDIVFPIQIVLQEPVVDDLA